MAQNAVTGMNARQKTTIPITHNQSAYGTPVTAVVVAVVLEAVTIQFVVVASTIEQVHAVGIFFNGESTRTRGKRNTRYQPQ